MEANFDAPAASQPAGADWRQALALPAGGAHPGLEAIWPALLEGTLDLAPLMESAQKLQDAGAVDAAARLYEHWISRHVTPVHHVACFNWGTLLGSLRRPEQAEAAYRRAIALSPRFAQAHLNLGHQLEVQGRIEEALATWRHVLELVNGAGADARALRVHALNNLARVCESQRDFPQAQSWLEASLDTQGGQWDVIQHWVHLRQKQCHWPLYVEREGASLNQQLVGTSPLAMLSVSDDPALQLMAAQRFVHERVPRWTGPPLHAERRRPGRIRIGYLSGDLAMHAVGLLVPELLELHDRARFEVYGFCWSRDDGSAQRTRLIAALDHHVRIGALDDDQAARRVAEADIDVLVDLQGLTQGARPGILVRRPAPAQVGYLGLPATSAVPGVDWILADPYVIPPEMEAYYTERPLRVPVCYQVSDRRREIGPVPSRTEAGLPEEGVVYASFNNNFKFTEPVFASWMRVLAAVPGSVLWLLADNDSARENMLRAADRHGVARSRLVFAPRVAPADYLARFRLADLFLDTFPYNAGTTASDCLWMGTPILTCSGRSYISRMAGSLLQAVGLPDLVTEDLPNYEQRAIQLGRAPARLASYRRYLDEHGRTSALYDLPARVRDIEDALAGLVRREGA